MQSEISHPRNFAHLVWWFACSRPLLEAKRCGIKVESKTVHIIMEHILKREKGRIGNNRFQSASGNDNAARICSKCGFRNLCKMPDKEHSALVLPRRKLGHPEIPDSCNISYRLWLSASKNQSRSH